MNHLINDYNLLLEQESHDLKVYALQQLFLAKHQIAFQKLQLLYTYKDDQFLNHLYKYTQLFDDSIKNQIILEHLEVHENYSQEFLHLLSSFTWDKTLLKLILLKVSEADTILQAKLISLLGQYRFLLPDHFVKRYLFSKSKEVSINTFHMLSKTPLAQDEKTFKDNIKNPNQQIVAACYAGLWKLGNTMLLLAFTSDDEEILKAPLIASKEIVADERVLNHLHRMLKSRNQDLCLLALNACIHKNSVEMLIDLIAQEEISFFDQALETCLTLDPEQSINHLLNYLEVSQSSQQDSSHLLNLMDKIHVWSRKSKRNLLSKPTLNQVQKYSKQISDQQIQNSKRNKFAHYFLTPKHVNDESWPSPLFER
ncbi:MAG: hypothetical protein KC646_13745 [Candidatus Cloacimonetes bacterium]|nr:hypothetical protein [Candidatus Cloacimonadota bacterium]